MNTFWLIPKFLSILRKKCHVWILGNFKNLSSLKQTIWNKYILGLNWEIMFHYKIPLLQIQLKMFHYCKLLLCCEHIQWPKYSQLAGLEPTLPEGIWFQVRRLNHSATTAFRYMQIQCSWMEMMQEPLCAET